MWRGKVLLHARYRGAYSAAKNQGRPWHVVAATATELVEAVNRGRSRTR